MSGDTINGGGPQSIDAANESGFALVDLRNDLSFELKNKHRLPQVSVRYLLTQLSIAAMKVSQGCDLKTLLTQLADSVRAQRGDMAPIYLGLVAFAKSRGIDVTAPVTPAEEAVVNEGAAKTAVDVQAVCAAKDAPVVSRRLPDIMNLQPLEGIRTVFPSISGLMLENVNLKMTQETGGTTQNPASGIDAVLDYFIGLVAKLPSLQADLDNMGVSLDSATRLIFMRYQTEASREQVRVHGFMRGRLETLEDISIADRARASIPARPPAGNTRSDADVPARAELPAALIELAAAPSAPAAAPVDEPEEGQK